MRVYTDDDQVECPDSFVASGGAVIFKRMWCQLTGKEPVMKTESLVSIPVVELRPVWLYNFCEAAFTSNSTRTIFVVPIDRHIYVHELSESGLL